jgi:hypothetical protein
LDSGAPPTKKGVVVLQFKLSSDGKISDLQVTKNTLDTKSATICWHAILDPAPYRSWPVDMLETISDGHREISFSFYY